MRKLPPTLTSSWQTGLVKPRGPNHCAIIFGSVHAFHTSARGASKTRERVTVPSPNLVAGLFMSFPSAVALCGLALVGLSQFREIELLHLQKRVGDALGFFGVRIRHHFSERGGDDLPGNAEFILQPAAGLFAAFLGQSVPEVVDLFLGVAINLEGHGLAELELWPAIERHERLPVDFEFCHHYGTWLLAVDLLAGFSITTDFPEFRILEHGDVERRRFLGFCIEPQTRRYLMLRERHDILLNARLLCFCEIGFELLQGAAPTLVHALMRSIENLLLFRGRVVRGPTDGEFGFAAGQIFKSERRMHLERPGRVAR